MKIALIGPAHPYRGGISHYNTVFCQNLEKKHQVKTISFKRLYPKLLFPGKDQKDLDSEKKIDTESIKAEEIIDSINSLTWFKTYKRVKKFKPQIVMMYWWTPFFTFVFGSIAYMIRNFTKSKVVFLCHNVVSHETRFIDNYLTKLALRNSDYFIVHASKEKKVLEKLIPGAKVIQHVHPTYDVFESAFKKKDISHLKLKKKTILFFGFVREYKGLIYLIKAMPHILKKVDLDLLIVGEFWGGSKVKKQYTDLIKKLKLEKNIKIIDSYVPNEEVGNYFEASDIVVLPYLSATNSGIIQISFALNKPVIVTNVGGLPEVVTHNKTGLVIPPKDEQAIADAIILYYQQKLRNKFIKNIKKERHRFSWDRLIEVVEDIEKGKYD